MANKQKSQIEVDLCGKKYVLTPTFEAICEMEDKARTGIPAMFQSARKGKIGIKDIAAVIYGGIIGTGKHELSYEQVGAMVRKTGLKDLASPVVLLLLECMYDGSDDAEKKTDEQPE